MTRLPHLRVIVDDMPNSGAWNMAVDEVLLTSAIETGDATLRFYQWSEPTVSLGYFQKEDEVLRERRLAQLPWVRRLSGGGTLVHDHELTYSLALPSTQRLVERPMELYGLVHRAFIEEFQRRGIELKLRGSTLRRSDEPLLCFAREDEHDLVFLGHKVLGSAQRRRRGAMLQHGGLLLQASSVTPELCGLADLFPTLELTNLATDLSRVMARSLAERSETGSLTPGEIQAVRSLAEQGRRLMHGKT